MDVYGAKGVVYLKYQGNMEDLAKKIAKGMQLPEFYFKSDQVPPHEISGLNESMGFEIWLKSSSLSEEFPFLLKIETGHSDDGIMDNRMHDLSPWLARYVREICEIETDFLDTDSFNSV